MKMQILKNIRSIATNILATTALTVLIMCLAGVIQGYTLWGVTVPFEMLLVNFLMHLGFFFIDKIEFKNRTINYAIMLLCLIGIIIGFGILFNWFHANEIWIICLVGVLVFIFAIVIDVIKINRDAAEINEKLKKLREKETNEKE